MTSRIYLECDFCKEELICWNESELFDAGWLELRYDGNDEEGEEVINFCSKECAFLYFEEELEGEKVE